MVVDKIRVKYWSSRKRWEVGEKRGFFIIGENEIIGPLTKITLSALKNYGEVGKLLKKLIEEENYEGLKKYFNVEIGKTSMRVTSNKLSISRLSDKHSLTSVYPNPRMKLTLYDVFMNIRDRSTFIVSTDDARNVPLHSYEYIEVNPSWTLAVKWQDSTRTPEYVSHLIEKQELYKIFEKIIPGNNAMISVSRNYTSKRPYKITFDVRDEGFNVRTEGYVKDEEISTIRFIRWPFIEGMYSFWVDLKQLRKPLVLQKTSVSSIRKVPGVRNITKELGPPHGTIIRRDEWDIQTDGVHLLYISKKISGVKIMFSTYSKKITVTTPMKEYKIEPETKEVVAGLFESASLALFL